MAFRKDDWKTELQGRLERTKSELVSLEEQKRDLEMTEARLRKEREAYETLLHLEGDSKPEETGKSGPDWNLLLNGKSHRDKVITIARECGARIKLTPATDLLFNGGFMKSKNRGNSYGILQHLMSELVHEGIFERDKQNPGEYLLTVNPEKGA